MKNTSAGSALALRWLRALALGSCCLAVSGAFAGCGSEPEESEEGSVEEEGDESIGEDTLDLVAANGLKAEYYDNADFTSLKHTRTDAKVDFSWTGVPADNMGSNYFSIRWTGQVQAKYSETYRFYVTSDDGARLWVNGKLLVDNWASHSVTENSGTIPLVAGQKYDIKLEYWEKIEGATARLRWSSPSTAKQVVPTASLFNSTGSTTPPPPPPPPPPPAGSGPTIAGCPMFPSDNAWNKDISGAAVDANSANYINYIMNSGGDYLKADFGTFAGYGIPYVVVPGTQPKVPMTFDWADESDPGPYPFPNNAPIENGSDSDGDRHVIVVDKDNCKLYETYYSFFTNPGWHAASGAVWDLRSNASRPAGWTSADAANLPILPGLVRYEEAVTAGAINHALRFTVTKTQRAYVAPAGHWASTVTDPNAPPMGLRLRLKANFDISGYTGAAKVVLTALKKYGMILADNGSNWFISGTSDPGFNDTNLNTLKNVPGTAFEVIATGPITKP